MKVQIIISGSKAAVIDGKTGSIIDILKINKNFQLSTIKYLERNNYQVMEWNQFSWLRPDYRRHLCYNPEEECK